MMRPELGGLSGMENPIHRLSGICGPLDTGGSMWERSLHNREELGAPYPEARWGEGGLQAERSADWPDDSD